MRTPENRQFSVGIGHQLTDVVALNVDYIHQDARNLYVQLTPNWFNTQTGHRNLTDSYGTITLYDDAGRAKFDALVGGLTYNRPALRLNGALDAAGNALTNYGTPNGLFAARQAQLGLRYEF